MRYEPKASTSFEPPLQPSYFVQSAQGLYRASIEAPAGDCTRMRALQGVGSVRLARPGARWVANPRRVREEVLEASEGTRSGVDRGSRRSLGMERE